MGLITLHAAKSHLTVLFWAKDLDVRCCACPAYRLHASMANFKGVEGI
jgi:hypothetical protein